MKRPTSSPADNAAVKWILGVSGTLIVLVLIGSYGYTMSADLSQDTEKERWRSEHNRVLNQRFEEVKQGQEKIEKKLDEKAEKTDAVLREILIEQRAANIERSRSSRGSGR